MEEEKSAVERCLEIIKEGELSTLICTSNQGVYAHVKAAATLTSPTMVPNYPRVRMASTA